MRIPASAKVAAYLIAVLLLLIAGGIALLHTSFVEQYALRQLTNFLDRQGVSFEAASLDYNLLQLKATLRNLKIGSTISPELPPLVAVDRVTVRLGVRQLLSGRYRIEDAVLDNPSVHLMIDERSRNNIPVLPVSGGGGETKWSIGALRASGGSLVVEDRREKLRIELPAWKLSLVDDSMAKRLAIHFDAVRPGQALFEQRSRPIDVLSADLLLTDRHDSVEIKQLNVASGETSLALSGTIHNLQNPILDLRAESRLSLASLLQLSGIPTKASGILGLQIAASGPLNEAKIAAKLEAKELEIERFKSVEIAGAALYDVTAKRFRISSLQVGSPAGLLEAQADLALATEAGDSFLNVRVSSLDLEPVSRALASPMAVASRTSGTIAVHWSGLSYQKASGSASLTLAAMRPAARKNVVAVSGTLSAFSRESGLLTIHSDLRALDAAARGVVTVSAGKRLDGELQLRAPNLNDTIGQISAFLGKKDFLGAPVEGAVSASVKVGGSLDQPAMIAQVTAPELTFRNLHNVAVELDTAFDPSQVVIRRADVRWSAQSMTVTGRVGLNQASPALDLSARIDHASIPDVLARLATSDIPVTGVLSANARITGSAKNPTAEVLLSGSDLEAYGEPLGDLAAQARLENRVIRLNRFRLDMHPGGLETTGTYDLDTHAYAVETQGKDIQFLRLTLPGGIPVRGDPTLSAKGAGTLEDPNLTLDLNVRNLEVRGQPLGSIEARLEITRKEAKITAQAPAYNLGIDGRVGIDRPYPAHLEVIAKAAKLVNLPLKHQLSGTVTGSVAASGDLENLGQLQGTARVSDLQVAWNGQPIRNEGPLEFEYADRVLTIHRAAIVGADSRLQIAGKFPLEESAGGGILGISGSFDLENLTAFLPPAKRPTASGRLTLEGGLRGSLHRMDPTAIITLREGSFATPQLESAITNMGLDAQIRDGALVIDRFSAGWASGRIEASGEVPFSLFPYSLPLVSPRRQRTTALTLDIKGLQLATLPTWAQGVTGKVSAHLEAQIPRPDLKSVIATITFPELNLNLHGYELLQQDTSAITVQDATARIQRFDLAGPHSRLAIGGEAGLESPYPLNIKFQGDLDAAVLTMFTKKLKALGNTTLLVAVSGTAKAPHASGFLDMKEGQFSLVSAPVQGENLAVRLELSGDQVKIARLEGSLNGGMVQAGGSARYASGELRDVAVNVTSRNFYLEFPRGLHSVSNSNLKLSSAGKNLQLSGDFTILEGSYTEPLSIEAGLLAYLRSPQGTQLIGERSPLLSRVNLDFRVKTASPLVVNNNLAKAAIDADLHVRGTAEQSGVTGRINLGEGGELDLNERKYLIDRGVISFTNDRRIEPLLDILARTTAAGYDISMQIQGDALTRVETILTSDPPLPEPDIIAILVTGRTLEESRGQGAEIAKEQVLSYLTGSVGGALSRQAQQTLGLSQVRIEPSLIAAETQPTARLTIGQDITRKFSLTYSMNLRDSNDQIWIGNYDITKRFSTQAVKQSDNTYRFEFRHDLQFGGALPPTSTPTTVPRKKVIGNVAVTGNTYFTSQQILDRLKVRSGKEYDFFKVRAGLDRLQDDYAKKDLLEARVGLERKETGSQTDLTVRAAPGPMLHFVYEGGDVSGSTRKKVDQSWREGVIDEQRTQRAIQLIQEELIGKGYLRASVESSISLPEDKNKRVLFEIHPGTRFHDVKLLFEGTASVDPSTLKDLVKDQHLEAQVYSDPDHIKNFLERYYQGLGYLDASVENPRYELHEETATGEVVIPVREGPLYRVGNLEFNGNAAYTAALLRDSVPLAPGDVYTSGLQEKANRAIQELYYNQGYADVELQSRQQKIAERGRIDLIYEITENKQRVLAAMEVTGNHFTSENLIRAQIGIKIGEPLSSVELSRARRNLYATNAFSLVDMEVQPLSSSDLNLRPNQMPVKLTANVREVRPAELRYGGFFDTERGPGGIADFSIRNMLGGARVVGFRTRYDSQLREARLYFGQPLLLRFPLKSTFTSYVRREIMDTFFTDRVGASAEEEIRFGKHFILTAGYRFENTHTRDKILDPLFPFDVRLRIAPLTTSLSRETRDELLDATRGSFTSHAFEYAAGALGSQLTYVRYFGQYFKYIPLSKPQSVPWTNQRKTRFVYAGGVRVGLAAGLGGQVLIPSERFFTGGGTTIRGFQQNHVGPLDILGEPRGGDAVLIINNEIRFPIFHIFDGVGFVDAGNVYRNLSDFDLTDLRKSAGVGLRVRTPYFLLRLDYGLKLDRKVGEDRGQLFFSIGQAF